MRQRRMTWSELQQALQKQGFITTDEEIKELTLVKPRQLLIRTEVATKE